MAGEKCPTVGMDASEELSPECPLRVPLIRVHPNQAVQWWDLGYLPFLVGI